MIEIFFLSIFDTGLRAMCMSVCSGIVNTLVNFVGILLASLFFCIESENGGNE